MSKAISPNFREGLTAQNQASGQNEYLYSTNHALNVAITGSSPSSSIVGIDPIGQSGTPYDTVVYTNTSTTVDTYTYRSGGVGGSVTATVTITYTDVTKSQVSTIVRT